MKAGERNHVTNALVSRVPGQDDQPVTKADLSNLREDFLGELHGSLTTLRDELIDKMRDMQTEVLRAFHGWASPIEIRLRSLPNIEERLGLLEERVSTIERRDKLN